ncbi:hypothetical protein ACIGFL_09235 [Pseudomonas sp. NPDC077649]|uniref:hypothetical protein n=1 Tax=Pseudomonas sp. NPDC077649 TaxID=3364423 RepID=UPI0037C9EF0B
MSQLPDGTFAYRWFNSGLGRNQITLRSTGGDVVYDTTMTIVGFTRDHTKLIVSGGASMRIYEVASGLFDEVSFGATTSVYAIHPSRPEVLVGRVTQAFLEWYDFEEDSYTATGITVSGTGIAEFNPAGDTLFLTKNSSPYLLLFDADTLESLPNPYTDVTNYINAEPRLSVAFNRVLPQVAMSLTGDRWMGVFNTNDGQYIWDIYNPDSAWAYWLSFNPAGDLLSVSSDAFSLSTHTRICDAFTPVNGPAVVVRNIGTPSAAGFVHGVFTGDGDSMVVCNHPTLASSIINARTGDVLEALDGNANSMVGLPPYSAPVIGDLFWTRRTRTQEII